MKNDIEHKFFAIKNSYIGGHRFLSFLLALYIIFGNTCVVKADIPLSLPYKLIDSEDYILTVEFTVNKLKEDLELQDNQRVYIVYGNKELKNNKPKVEYYSVGDCVNGEYKDNGDTNECINSGSCEGQGSDYCDNATNDYNTCVSSCWTGIEYDDECQEGCSSSLDATGCKTVDNGETCSSGIIAGYNTHISNQSAINNWIKSAKNTVEKAFIVTFNSSIENDKYYISEYGEIEETALGYDYKKSYVQEYWQNGVKKYVGDNLYHKYNNKWLYSDKYVDEGQYGKNVNLDFFINKYKYIWTKDGGSDSECEKGVTECEEGCSEYNGDEYNECIEDCQTDCSIDDYVDSHISGYSKIGIVDEVSGEIFVDVPSAEYYNENDIKVTKEEHNETKTYGSYYYDYYVRCGDCVDSRYLNDDIHYYIDEECYEEASQNDIIYVPTDSGLTEQEYQQWFSSYFKEVEISDVIDTIKYKYTYLITGQSGTLNAFYVNEIDGVQNKFFASYADIEDYDFYDNYDAIFTFGDFKVTEDIAYDYCDEKMYNFRYLRNFDSENETFSCRDYDGVSKIYTFQDVLSDYNFYAEKSNSVIIIKNGEIKNNYSTFIESAFSEENLGFEPNAYVSVKFAKYVGGSSLIIDEILDAINKAKKDIVDEIKNNSDVKDIIDKLNASNSEMKQELENITNLYSLVSNNLNSLSNLVENKQSLDDLSQIVANNATYGDKLTNNLQIQLSGLINSNSVNFDGSDDIKLNSYFDEKAQELIQGAIQINVEKDKNFTIRLTGFMVEDGSNGVSNGILWSKTNGVVSISGKISNDTIVQIGSGYVYLKSIDTN